MVDFKKFNQDYADYYAGDDSKLAQIYTQLPDILTSLYNRFKRSADETVMRDAAIGKTLMKMIPLIKERGVPLVKATDSLSNYTGAAIRNNTITQMRKKENHTGKLESYTQRLDKQADDPLAIIIAQETESNQLKALRTEIDNLPKLQKTAINHYYFPYENGWESPPTFDEIAEKLGENPISMRGAARNGRIKLVDRMLELGLTDQPSQSR